MTNCQEVSLKLQYFENQSYNEEAFSKLYMA